MSEFKWNDELVEDFCLRVTDRWNLADKISWYKKSKDAEKVQSKQQTQSNKDWEIVSFEDKDGFVTNRQLIDGFTFPYKECYKIRAIKRLSDGEVFSIGDNCLQGEIKRFHITLNELFAEFEDGEKGCTIPLFGFKKQKQPLFKSEDGIDIYDNTWCWLVHNNYFTIEKVFIHPNEIKGKLYKYFSTEEAAQQYVLYNKPCLSLQEVMNYYDSIVNRIAPSFKVGLVSFTQQKINNIK